MKTIVLTLHIILTDLLRLGLEYESYSLDLELRGSLDESIDTVIPIREDKMNHDQGQSCVMSIS